MTSIPFTKMHGLGNDFVIIDARAESFSLQPQQAQHLADRRLGIGCDQVIVLEPSARADAAMRIYNADGGEVGACGNATRCVAWLLLNEMPSQDVTIETHAGLLACMRVEHGRIRADMGEPKLDWQQIPLSEPQDTLHLDIHMGHVHDPVAVSMGNPHVVFIVEQVEAIAVGALGPVLECHHLFPERANISFAEPLSRSHIALRVWERGAGETLACGSAACATLVALHRRGLVARKAQVDLPGGSLDIEWDAQTNHVWMTGPVALSFNGQIAL